MATLENEESQFQYTANGSTASFSFPALFYTKDDGTSTLVVNVTPEGETEPTLKTEGVDYDITGAGLKDGGSVVFRAGHYPPANSLVDIQRIVSNTQLSDYEEGGTFPASTVTADFNKVTMQNQQQQRQLDKALRFPTNDPLDLNNILPAKAARANKYLYFDANGEPIASAFAGTPESIADKSLTPAKWEDLPANTVAGCLVGGDMIYLTKAQLLALLTLDQVNNTADSAKPVSTAQAAALALKLAAASNLADLQDASVAKNNLGLKQLASSALWQDILSKPSFGAASLLGLGTGLVSSGGNINIDSTFLQSLLSMPMAGFAAYCTGWGAGYTEYPDNYSSTEIFDTHNAYHSYSSNSEAGTKISFTCPTGQAGTYYFKFVVANSSYSPQLHKNRVSFATGSTGTVAGSVVLAEGDVVEFYNSGSLSGDVWRFYGYRIA